MRALTLRFAKNINYKNYLPNKTEVFHEFDIPGGHYSSYFTYT